MSIECDIVVDLGPFLIVANDVNDKWWAKLIIFQNVLYKSLVFLPDPHEVIHWVGDHLQRIHIDLFIIVQDTGDEATHLERVNQRVEGH